MKVSLCILACGQGERILRLTESLHEFEGLEVEIVIGDNSPLPEQQEFNRRISDVWLPITDRELWFDGFGACKQKIVVAATQPWVLIADPDEQWHPIAKDGGKWAHSELVAMEQAGGCPRVFRTALVEGGRVVAEHGRVYHRRDFRLMGMIHEELYSRRARQNWSLAAPMQPFAQVEHFNGDMGEAYMARKGVLYDNILDRITKDPSISTGTRVYWHREYWPSRLAEGFTPTSFEEWTTEYGGV
jgi:hypothetical protein